MTWTVSLIAPIILGLLTLLFPFKALENKNNLDFATLKERYQKWELFALIPLFLFLPLMTYLFGTLLANFYTLVLTKSSDTIFQVIPEQDMWYVPAGILSFGLIGFPMTFIYQLILEDRYEEYTYYTNLKHGFDGLKVFKPMAWILGIAATILLLLMTDYSIKVKDNKIILNDFATFTDKIYDFNQIKSIDFVENTITQDKQTLTPNPHYYIRFNDNNYWNTQMGLKNEIELEAIMKFLAHKSNLKIDTVSYILD